jgi:uncharacterized protein (DUF362 family)
MPLERVSLRRCHPASTGAEVVRATEETIAALGDLGAPGERLRRASRIAVKINAGVNRLRIEDGRRVEVTDPAVVEGTVRFLRCLTDAEILVGDIPSGPEADAIYPLLGLQERLDPIPGVRLFDFGQDELVEAPMRHPNPMFRRYTIPRTVAEADAVVSVAKMKAHSSIGCTLCIKNLFGWLPTSVYGLPRMYLHDRLIRLPHVLADLAQWLQPCLNVVDATLAANLTEWGGEPLKPGLLLAGTNCVAVDATGARVMGFDPEDDYPNHPFLYRHNAIRLAGRAGLGPLAESGIETIGPEPAAVYTRFTVLSYDETVSRAESVLRRNQELRRGARCVAHYEERRPALLDRCGEGQYLALKNGDVLFDGPDMTSVMRWEHDTHQDWRNGPEFVVRLLPEDKEIEDLSRYAAEAATLIDP